MSDKTYWTIAEPAASAREQVPLGRPADTRPIFVPREQVIRTPKCGARGQLTNTSNTTVYTAPSVSSPTGATQGALLKALWLSNSDSSARTITAHLVESGGSVAANRLILPTVTIPANSSLLIRFPDDTCPMDSGEFLNLVASTANTISYRVTVVELT